MEGKDALLEDCRIMQDHLTNCSAIDAELDELLREIAVVTELTQRCIQENAQSAQSTARQRGGTCCWSARPWGRSSRRSRRRPAGRRIPHGVDPAVHPGERPECTKPRGIRRTLQWLCGPVRCGFFIEEINRVAFLRYDPITDTIQFFLRARVQGGSNLCQFGSIVTPLIFRANFHYHTRRS